MDKKNKILEFINLFKSANPNLIEKIYLNGGCYRFYLIIKTLYPEAVPYKVGLFKNSIDHIVTKIDDYFYDVLGVFKLEKTNYKYISSLTEEEKIKAEKFKY